MDALEGIKTVYEVQAKSLRALLEAAQIYHRVLCDEREHIPPEPEVQAAYEQHRKNVLEAVNVFEIWWRVSVEGLNLSRRSGRGSDGA